MTARRKGAADTAPRLTPRAPELLAADPALSRMWDLVSSPGSAGLAKILAVGSLVAAGVVVDESGGVTVPCHPTSSCAGLIPTPSSPSLPSLDRSRRLVTVSPRMFTASISAASR